MLHNLIGYLRRLKSGTEELNYGREIVARWAERHLRSVSAPGLILDIGVGRGDDLLNIRRSCSMPLELHGIECHPPNAKYAAQQGIVVKSLDMERERFPYPDASFDLVVANQIIEHTKEIFFIFSEISRVLKTGGLAIIGVPNLASLHNRVALLLGLQPPAIRVLGPHVRGFTRDALREFFVAGDFFALEDFAGANFYPLPPPTSKWMARLFPGLAVSSFYKLRRTDRRGTFAEVLDQHFFETPYYRGPGIS
jgi:ubiquinone/menaquinone biosynthesis C-methylase UbiE